MKLFSYGGESMKLFNYRGKTWIKIYLGYAPTQEGRFRQNCSNRNGFMDRNDPKYAPSSPWGPPPGTKFGVKPPKGSFKLRKKGFVKIAPIVMVLCPEMTLNTPPADPWATPRNKIWDETSKWFVQAQEKRFRQNRSNRNGFMA